MLKFILILMVLMIEFIIFNQFIFPALGCGSTIGETLAFLSIPIFIYLGYLTIKKIK